MRTKLLGPVAAVLAATALWVSGPQASAALPVLQPGSSISDSGATTFCTLNWIYDGTGAQAGKVFAGTAGHCFKVGQRVAIATGSLGRAVATFGTVAYRSAALDFELIRVDSPCACQVVASMAGHPDIPAGVSTSATAKVGDLMQFSGHGVVFDLTALTREQRVGILGYNDGSQQFVYGAVTPGDSGGPVADLTDGKKAFGVVDTLGIAVMLPLPQIGEGGVMLDGLLADAAAHGFPVRVRTV